MQRPRGVCASKLLKEGQKGRNTENSRERRPDEAGGEGELCQAVSAGLPTACKAHKRQITSALQVHPSMTGQFWLLQSPSFWDESASCLCSPAHRLLSCSRPCIGRPQNNLSPFTSSLALPEEAASQGGVGGGSVQIPAHPLKGCVTLGCS